MISSIEMNSVRKGYDPRDFALVGLGGAGPLHACRVAQELSIPAVVIPPNPGITSALGLLATDIVYDYSKTELMFTSKPDTDRLNRDFAELEQRAMQRLSGDGLKADRIVLERLADCRYFGQGYELRVPVMSGEVNGASIANVRRAFDEAHLKEYKTLNPDNEVEIVNIRVMAIGLMPRLSWQRLDKGQAEPPMEALRSARPVIFEQDGVPTEISTPHFERSKLLAGNQVVGPAIIEQEDSTTLIPPGMAGTVDDYGNIIIRL